ncbi:MAG: hypothetical protein F4X99_16660 [Gammaproteobacteria bacterium]|nr:hypothetical protein [Gammaproteobacteria bacterium]
MRRLLNVWVLCVGGSVLSAPANGADWYVSAAAGAVSRAGMDQNGSNRESTCYPTDACFHEVPRPAIAGYRWTYDIDADAGPALRLGIGRRLGRFRIETSVGWQRNALEQELIDIAYLDGTPRVGADSTVTVDARALIDDAVTRTVSVDLFRDLPPIGGSVTPYIGIGVGSAYITVKGLGFVAEYRDTSQTPPAYDPPLSHYAAAQEEDHSDSVVTWRVHAGADYALGERTLLGARLTWSVIGSTSDTGRYDRHPIHATDPAFRNRNGFEEARAWALTVSLTRWFGGGP